MVDPVNPQIGERLMTLVEDLRALPVYSHCGKTPSMEESAARLGTVNCLRCWIENGTRDRATVCWHVEHPVRPVIAFQMLQQSRVRVSWVDLCESCACWLMYGEEPGGPGLFAEICRYMEGRS
jgi:hypothetical protein